MKFRAERDAVADAVAWVARSLPARPALPVLAGMLLDLDGHALTVAGFDYEVSARMDLEVTGLEAGRVLVSGRLLAEITRSLPAQPVEITTDGSRVVLSCGSARFTLPTLPVEDYPPLPSMPEVAGSLESDVFGSAVGQVAVAAGRDETLPVLTGVRLEIEGERLTLAATDRYRLAVRELSWRPEASSLSATALVPARTLAETARSLTSGAEVTLALTPGGGPGGATGEGMVGFEGAGRRTTTRLLEGEFPKYRALLPTESAANAEVPTAQLVEALKRVALVAPRTSPVRLTFDPAGSLLLEAGGADEASATEHLEAGYSGEGMTIAFNPGYLLDGLSVLDSDVARLAFTTPTKPAILTGKSAEDGGPADYRYLLMPVRISV